MNWNYKSKIKKLTSSILYRKSDVKKAKVDVIERRLKEKSVKIKMKKIEGKIEENGKLFENETDVVISGVDSIQRRR